MVTVLLIVMVAPVISEVILTCGGAGGRGGERGRGGDRGRGGARTPRNNGGVPNVSSETDFPKL